VIATLDIPRDSAYFAGHFPERPILPAVAQLALVVNALARPGGPRTTLRAIPYLRLRQLVRPGDSLRLGAHEDGEQIRFELRRGDELVSNGALVLGEPVRRQERSQTMGGGSPPRELPPWDELLPHRSPMRFVTAVEAERPDGLTCCARIPIDCALVSQGSVPAFVGIEAAAQTAGTWEVLRRSRDAASAGARIGYVVAMRDVECSIARIPAEETLIASVALIAVSMPLTHYAIDVTLAGTPIVRGTLATCLAD
jgi:3-hydroxyacyl-[acyl-carrier-protein] dehydratase